MINIAVAMLFSELNDLTGGKCTHEEYEIINNVYMSCDSMTHEDCAKAWKALFFKRYKENIKKREINSHSWKFFSSLVDKEGPYSPEGTINLPNGDVVRYRAYAWSPNGCWPSREFALIDLSGGLTRKAKEVIIAKDTFGQSLRKTKEGQEYFNS